MPEIQKYLSKNQKLPIGPGHQIFIGDSVYANHDIAFLIKINLMGERKTGKHMHCQKSNKKFDTDI